MNDKKMVEPEVLQGDAHRFGGSRRLRKLHFKTQPLAVRHREQVEFRTGLGLPEPRSVRSQVGEDLLQNKTFPECACRWMQPEGRLVADAEQSVEQAAVTDVKFGRFPLPFTNVFMPRLQTPDYEGVFENIKVVADGGARPAKGLPQLGQIEEPAVKMGAHHPKSAQLRGGHPHPILREIPK